MSCPDEYSYIVYHPNCACCPRYMDDCDGDGLKTSAEEKREEYFRIAAEEACNPNI